jgi:hypothetical protein
MDATADWDIYVRSRFPGYLLPESAAQSLSVEEARRFLEAVAGRPDQLDILRAVSVFSPRIASLQTFVRDAVADLVRNLPSRTARLRREWEGGFQGRLAVAETLDLHMAGRRTTFVTQSRRRSFDLPENVFLRAICERLLSLIVSLRAAKAMPDAGWGTGIRESEGILRRLLSSTALREVPSARATVADENAARAARHDAYRQAVTWASWLREALDDDDPRRIARVVSEGALLPLADSTRFELAVAIRFAEALHVALDAREPSRWRAERALVLPGRKDILAFVRDDGVTVRVFYNQAVLPAGAADLGGAHYLGNTGRLRPDVTVTISRGEERLGATVMECKLTENAGYILSGYHEAMLYRWEYAEHLLPWPKAILVASGSVQGSARASDDVIATTWKAWPSPAVITAIADFAHAKI